MCEDFATTSNALIPKTLYVTVIAEKRCKISANFRFTQRLSTSGTTETLGES
jgi:hypothetical protein